ncbi:class III aminotransferase [Deinococcus irradiatisoli]|uniref:Class III aminotransferase n=2 Tax=Deinococcus irradiatisoli TaxID=2202254 RepID=A0A2Z3JNA1_9DEIO|nr:class III aminotransferase [Deinococcus irradiatisoli]
MLAAAPNGGRHTAQDHPALPLTPASLARTAAECLDAGANLLHVHVRDAQGRHTLDAATYREAFAAIRSEVGERLVLQATTEALGRYSAAEQLAAVRGLRPEAVSLAVAELFGRDVPDADVAAFLRELQLDQVLVQYIVYSAAEEQRLVALAQRGLIPGPFWTLYVLGRYGQARPSTPADLLPFAPFSAGRAAAPWAACAFGQGELRCLVAAAAFGGHVQIGFENNLLTPEGEPATSNAEQVRRLRNALTPLNIMPMSADELRRAWLTPPDRTAPR